MRRKDLIKEAVDRCMQELYSISQPEVSWKNFKRQCKKYSNKYKLWEKYKKLETESKERALTEKELEIYSILNDKWYNKSIDECIGPKPFEFYYLPDKVLKEITSYYIDIYKLDSKQDLLLTIDTLKNYCKEPIIDKYIEGHIDEYGNHHPGYRGYDHPDNLEKEVQKILNKYGDIYDEIPDSNIAEELCNKFFEFLDMAGNFFNWTAELNKFNYSIYLGVSPSSNKQAVIDNWKKYRNKNIEIDDSKYIEEDDYNE